LSSNLASTLKNEMLFTTGTTASAGNPWPISPTQLSCCNDCGYNSASLRERLYSRWGSDHGGPMAGILIYTAAPDSEGTLGGLVELGNPASMGRDRYHPTENEIELGAKGEGKTAVPIQSLICVPKPINSSE
jgi:hypothetical protein